MIQFNLLPDVKLEYIKSRHMQRLVTTISSLVSVAAIAVLLLSLVTVDIVQKKSLNDLDKDITTNSNELKAIPDLDKILTVQNQLNTITGLHDQKMVSSRLFTYISELTPKDATISSLSADFTQNTLSLTGTAPSLDVVNQFIDTLKSTTYATYTLDDAGKSQQAADDAYYKEHNSYPSSDGTNGTVKAFTSVVLATFGKDTTGTSYTITMNSDPLIFSNTNTTELRVPTGTVTNTSILFKAGAAK